MHFRIGSVNPCAGLHTVLRFFFFFFANTSDKHRLGFFPEPVPNNAYPPLVEKIHVSLAVLCSFIFLGMHPDENFGGKAYRRSAKRFADYNIAHSPFKVTLSTPPLLQ